MGHYLSDMDPDWRDRAEQALTRQVEESGLEPGGTCKKCGLVVGDVRKHISWHRYH